MCVWYSGWPGGFTVLPLRHAGLEAPAMQAWLLLPCSPRWGTRRTRVHMCLWRTSLFNNENLNWTLGHNFTAQHNYLTCWCTSIYMADVIRSPFFFYVLSFLCRREEALCQFTTAQKKKKKKKAPKPSIFTTKIFIFSPPFLHFFFFFSQNKIFQGTDEWRSGQEPKWLRGRMEVWI